MNKASSKPGVAPFSRKLKNQKDYSKPLDVVGLYRRCHGLARGITKEKFDNIPVSKRMTSL
jgi:hypothetical protein